MSVVTALYGVLGLLGLFLVIAASMTFAARAVGRVVGLSKFRWFDERPAKGAWWRRLVVCAASMVAPLGVSFVLFWGAFLAGGAPQVEVGTQVEVLEGAARDGGIRDGDRVLRIDGAAIADWEQLRAAVKRHTGATAIEVERAGQTLVLSVTPRGGRIGVRPVMRNQQLGVVAAARLAIATPFSVIRATARQLVRTGADKAELAGPVGIVRETSKAGQESGVAFVSLLAIMAGYLWPFAASVVLFEVVTGFIFRAAHPEAATSSQRGYRLERLRQAALFACAGYVTFLLAAGLDAAGVPLARVLLIGAVAAGAAGYPLLWIGGKEVWDKRVAALVLVGSIFVPCVMLLAVLVLRHNLGRALKAEAFRVTWLSAQPPLRTTEQSRWGG